MTFNLSDLDAFLKEGQVYFHSFLARLFLLKRVIFRLIIMLGKSYHELSSRCLKKIVFIDLPGLSPKWASFFGAPAPTLSIQQINTVINQT